MTSYDYFNPRTSLAITWSVWHALFLREAVARISRARGAWIWLLLEPVLHILIMLFLFTVIRMRTVEGIDTVAWLVVGLVFFFGFRRTALQTQNALSANRSLFTYRQVKPIDTILVRAALECFLTILIAIILGSGGLLFGVELVPTEPLEVMGAFFGLWLLGLGYGSITSVAVGLVPEFGKFLSMIMMPIYLTSGVVIPVARIPQPFRGWMLYNPIAHGLEVARSSISPYYHAVYGVNLTYLYVFAIVMVFFGLVLHRRFAIKLATR